MIELCDLQRGYRGQPDETLPDIRQSKHLALLYGLTLDELIAFDLEVQEIQEVIDRTREEVSDKIDWTKAWSKKYPVLGSAYDHLYSVHPYYDAHSLHYKIDVFIKRPQKPLQYIGVFRAYFPYAFIHKTVHNYSAVPRRYILALQLRLILILCK